ncbi:MAG: DUF3857 domain-containing protein, partial [Deltaproteobacteria bacterium]|nr:DUF3857 domain-containing protein [Deltaproteobacteria bacterium]
DVGTLRSLADLHGERGDRGEQLSLLGRVRELAPGDADVREYLRILEPSGARPDEAFALARERFLPLAGAPRGGQSQRTLVDLTVTTVFESGLSSRFRQIVFQPLTEAAAAAGRQYVFQYQADSERVQLRGARVFRADGRVDEATESGEGAADDPSIAMYTSARTFYVQLPRLEPGDVVDLRYRVDPTTTVNAFGDYFGEIVPLQASEPIAHAEYVVLTPRARRVHFDVARVPGVRRETSDAGEQRVHRFVAEQVPAVTPEPHMPPWSAVVGFVHASTYESWDALGRWYWGLVRDQLDLDDETRRLAREVTRGARTDEERVRAVYDWVVTSTRYVALEFGIYGYKPRRCVQTVTRGWGDCKDKAAVIVTLLRELGIDAELVLVRTGLRGEFASKLPSLAPFDHAIAYVPSLDLYLDGTAEGAGSTELPGMDQGSLALRVSARGVTPVRLPVAEAATNLRRREVHATLRADGAAQIEITLEARGSRAASFRKRFHAEATRRDRVTAHLAESLPGFELGQGAAAVALPTLDLEAP